MADSKDYDYYAHSGNHYMVTHENGRPRYQQVAVGDAGLKQRFNTPHENSHIEVSPPPAASPSSTPVVSPSALGADNQPGYLRNAADALKKRATTQNSSSPMSLADSQS
jgi:hypothetical protein